MKMNGVSLLTKHCILVIGKGEGREEEGMGRKGREEEGWEGEGKGKGAGTLQLLHIRLCPAQLGLPTVS